MPENYSASWNIPLFGGNEKRRSEMAAGQIQAIDKVAEEFDLEQEYREVIIDEYGGGIQEKTLDDLEEFDFENGSLKRADLEYKDGDEKHIGATYTRDSIVGENFRLEVKGDKEFRNILEEEIGQRLSRNGWRRIYDAKRLYNQLIKE